MIYITHTFVYLSTNYTLSVNITISTPMKMRIRDTFISSDAIKKFVYNIYTYTYSYTRIDSIKLVFIMLTFRQTSPRWYDNTIYLHSCGLLLSIIV